MNPANAVAKVRSITHAVRNRDPIRGDEPLAPGSGNYQAKSRRNFYISRRCWDMAHELSLDIGINHSAVIELAIREMYARLHGSVPVIEYHDGRRAK